MGCCNDNKLKHRCTDKVPSVCVTYDTSVPEWSKLQKEPCLTTSETTEELYDEVGKIRESLDFTKFAKCLEYEQADASKLELKEILARHQGLLCELTGKGEGTTKDTSIDITRWGLDYKCLVDVCGNPPSTLKQLLQLLIDRICGGVQAVYSSEFPLSMTAPQEIEETTSIVEDIDYTPDFQDTGIKGCSGSDTEYKPLVEGEFGFKQQIDVNINSVSYSAVRWVRDKDTDNICKG